MTTAIERVEPSPQLTALYERLGRAIEWLRDNDADGVFHLWFDSGLQPFSPMPAQEEARREAWKRYHKNRTVFESLWREMVNRERMEGLL